MLMCLFASLNFAWFDSNYTLAREINVSMRNATGTYYFNITTPIEINDSARWTTNSTGTELECGGYWKYKNTTEGVTWILNCTLLNGTTALRLYFNNTTGVSNRINISKGCLVGDDFNRTYNTALWTKVETAGTLTEYYPNNGSTGVMRLESSLAANAYLKSNANIPNFTRVDIRWYPEQETTGGYGSSIGVGQYNNFATFVGFISENNNSRAYYATSDGTARDISGLYVQYPNRTWKNATMFLYHPTLAAVHNGQNMSGTHGLIGNESIKLGTLVGLGAGEASNASFDFVCAYNIVNASGYELNLSAWSGDIVNSSGGGGSNATLSVNVSLAILPTPIRYENTSDCNLSINATKNVTVYWSLYRNYYLFSQGTAYVDAFSNTTLTTIDGNRTGDVWTCRARLCDNSTCTGYYMDTDTVMEITGGIVVYPLTASFVYFWNTWGALLSGTFAIGISWFFQRTISGTCLAASALNIAIYFLSAATIGASTINVIFAVALVIIGMIVRYTNN
jgi:hypothetical protein